MECDELADRLTEFMEGDLEPTEHDAALEHLATCTRCEQVLTETQDVTALARAHSQSPLTTADRSRVLAALHSHLDQTDT